MAQWEDDLRAVLEHRGAGLVEHARGLVAPSDRDGDADPAVGLTATALEAAFRRGGRRTTGEHGSVRLVDDDELDALAALVRREQERLARSRGDAAGPAPSAPRPDDGPSEALTAHLATVITHVREARRRGRRRGLVGSAAAVVVAALATTAFAARPWDRPTPDPAPTTTPYAGACGSHLPSGRSAIRVRYDGEWAGQSTIVTGQTWSAEFDGPDDDSEPDPATLGTVETMTPEVVLAQGGKVVALGVGTGEQTYTDAEGAPTDTPGFEDLLDGSPLYMSVRFAACDGGDVAPGAYQAHLFATTGDGSTHVLSEAAGLTVLTPTADGHQPSWLEGSALACGEEADDFLVRAAARPLDGFSEVGSASYDDGDALILRNRGAARRVALPRAAVAWVRGGRIVGVGPDERGTRTTTVGRGKQVEVSARPWDPTGYCTQAADGTSAPLPAGVYEAILYARVPSAKPGEPDGWVVEDERGNDLVVDSDGHVSYGDDAGTDALALTEKGFQPSWVRGSALRCAMTDDAFAAASARNPVAELDGTFSLDNQGRLGSELAVPGGGKTRITTPSRIGIAWFTATRTDAPGRLVSFGASPGPGHSTTVDGTTTSRYALLDATDSCAPGDDGTFAATLPPGRYWVAVYTWVQRHGGQRQWVTDGGAMGVAVREDGSVVGR